jgi:hypothetical protein
MRLPIKQAHIRNDKWLTRGAIWGAVHTVFARQLEVHPDWRVTRYEEKLYWVPDFERLGEEMHQKILFDGRNIWPRSAARRTFYNNIHTST